jgi:homogentisate 1,2-dioxygenase
METQYQSGFGNHFSSESVPGALPPDQNSPQKSARGLYAEQLSGSAFTAPRAQNLASWLYRLRPSVMHGKFTLMKEQNFSEPKHIDPNQMRWNPVSTAFKAEDQDFLQSIRTVCGNGSALEGRGIHVHLYQFSRIMDSRYFMNADGDFLFVPQSGSVEIKTELGRITAEPGEIAVVPRGMKFQVQPLKDGTCSGYLGENFGAPFKLPELGSIRRHRRPV